MNLNKKGYSGEERLLQECHKRKAIKGGGTGTFRMGISMDKLGDLNFFSGGRTCE